MSGRGLLDPLDRADYGRRQEHDTSPDEIYLSANQRKRLADLADRTGKSWEEVLAEALQSCGGRHALADDNGGQSFYPAALRLGRIGCVEGGPADLSTNPKYMEDFGESAS